MITDHQNQDVVPDLTRGETSSARCLFAREERMKRTRLGDPQEFQTSGQPRLDSRAERAQAGTV